MPNTARQQNLKTPNADTVVEVRDSDLPLHCPMTDSSLWNSHPQVYIPLQDVKDGVAQCPYCGTVYQLEHD